MIKTKKEAIELLTEKRGFLVIDKRDIIYNISDEKLNWDIRTEEELIRFANDQLKEVE